MKLLSKGNSKLDKKVSVWNILAGMEVCGRECDGCYAIKEQKRWKGTVVSGRAKRLELSKSDSFVADMVLEILKSAPRFVRVHGSGEFYSQEYINKWVKIALGVKKLRPYIRFYTYTKRDNEFDFTELDKASNFIVHRSFVTVDGKRKMNYGNAEHLNSISDKVESFICPLATDRTGKCGSECTWCMEKENQGTAILFEAH